MLRRDDQSDVAGNRAATAPAPGAPGAKATWSPAAKSGVGCAISSRSHVWFTLGRGIVTEVLHPWVDHAALRDVGFIITADGGFVSEEQRHCTSDTRCIEPGVPDYLVRNQCEHGRYELAKEILADPDRDVLLQRVRFSPRVGTLADYRLFVLASPRLRDQGQDNSGWIGTYHIYDFIFAQSEGHAMAVGCSAHWLRRSVGYVGASDARTDLQRHGKMTWAYDRADHGNIVLAGEIDLQRCGGDFVLAVGFDRTPQAAALNASLSLLRSFDEAHDRYVKRWQDWQKHIAPLDDSSWHQAVMADCVQSNRPDSSRPRVGGGFDGGEAPGNVYRTSMMAMQVHRSKQFAGASVAGLAVPWGEARGDDDLGGYHLVWPRDLSEVAAGMLAGGAHHEARCVLLYLQATQRPGGGWAQNMWLDGAAYDGGDQLDEAALPILLLELSHREGAIDDVQLRAMWPMARSAAAFIVCAGPSTGQSRWENTSGLSPYTIATEIAALVVAADWADQQGEKALGKYLRQTADLWNDLVDDWTYVTGAPLAHELGIDGYYIRIAPSPGMKALLERGKHPKLKSARDLPCSAVVSPDALALVRFGLRPADAPRILNTVKAIDAVTRVETPAGPCWRRYNGGYYGENDAGDPFTGAADEQGRGRAWPLLTGERGHFEVASGNFAEARRMLAALNGFVSQVGLLPEQVWDTDDLPGRCLFRGRASGSAMPLAWAHAEYVRLLRSLRDRRVFDMCPEVRRRYVEQQTGTDLAMWRFNHQAASFPAGRRLRIELTGPATIRFSTDGWRSWAEASTLHSPVGLHVVDLETERMRSGDRLDFTFRWTGAGERWEGKDFHLSVDGTRDALHRPGAAANLKQQTGLIQEVEH